MTKDILKGYLEKKKHEVSDMLAHSISREEWLEYAKKKSWENGKAEGRAEGKAEGILIGEKRGMIKILIAENKSDEEIMRIAEVSQEELSKYKKQIKNKA